MPADSLATQKPAAIELVAANHAHITQAEFAVLRLLLEQLTAERVARELGRSTATVNTHICRMREKTGAPDRGWLLVWAVLHLSCCLAAHFLTTASPQV